MTYSTDDIDFSKISPNEFERLCFELLLKYGFSQIIWRQGGADNGRDIEGYFDFNNPIANQRTKWFFECKHYTSGGVPPEHLNSKMAWADAEQPSYLVIFVSSYITTAARTWLESIKLTKQYKIIVIEGEELKGRLVQFPDLIERFFAADRFERLFLEIKNHWLRHRIEPSYELIKEISNNIDTSKLDIDDIGFLLMSFHKNYRHFELRNDYYGDFTEEVLEPLYPRLAELASKENLDSFEEYRTDFDYLGGTGCFDDAESDESSELAFQFYDLHLNHKKSQDLWKIGYYLFIKTNDNKAFELFSMDDSDFKTSAKYYEEFSSETLKELAIDISIDFGEKILEYSPRLLKIEE
ncbi:restriction endonuclease [uncultured Sunxiuqinia sp.]|uniref:restriction endonuclease n=1 Tax=uncultured Sunxiuqinia sp. TaxID=1573825 RepID=UPI002AA73944|nr:restriction endonuclease [uncultured Sunxiuqinia sp.]